MNAYERMCNGMAACFDSASHWIAPSMSLGVREEVMGALRGEGILPFFCREDDSDAYEGGWRTSLSRSSPSSSSPTAEEEYPYSRCNSLRAAHDRLGPCDGVNRLLSHPAVYCAGHNGIFTALNSSAAVQPTKEHAARPPLFASADIDVLTIVLSFLGYRSLARASQCCTFWMRAGHVQALWVALYFRKYGKRRPKPQFEEELLVPEIVNDADSGVSSEWQQSLALSKKVDYEWKHIFAKKYMIERCRRARTCNIVGCSHVIRRADRARSHMQR